MKKSLIFGAALTVLGLSAMVFGQALPPNGGGGSSGGGGGSGITALTGDVTASGTGSVAATLANIPATVTATSTSGTTITSSVANTGSNIGVTVNTTNSLTGTTSPFAIKVNGTVKANWESDLGWISYAGSAGLAGLFIGLPNTDGINRPLIALENNTAAYNSSPVVGLGFDVIVDSSNNVADIGGIQMGKSTVVSGNAGSYVAINTRTEANPGVITQAVKWDENQDEIHPSTSKIYWSKASARYISFESSSFKVQNLGPINVNDEVQGYGGFSDSHFNRYMMGVHLSNHNYHSPGMEYGTATASSNSVTVTFAQAFNNASSVFCQCTPIDTGGTATCTMNAAPSNTAVTFKTSGASTVVHYQCMGQE